MKKLIYLLVLFALPMVGIGQTFKTDAELAIDANVIKNETNPGANTKTRIGNMFLSTINSKVPVTYGVDATGTNDYAIEGAIDITTLEKGQMFLITFLTASTGDVTLNVEGLGALDLYTNEGVQATTGDIDANSSYWVVNTGTYYQMVGGTGASGGIGILSVVAGNLIDVNVTDPDNPIVMVETGDKGDVTIGSNTLTVDANAITFGKMQAITANTLLGAQGGTAVEEITITSPLTLSSNSLGIQQATTAQSGYLTSTDWNTFDGKQNAITFGANMLTFLATPSSANLAATVTNETGTDALVFANSPTLTGTPTAPTASGTTSTTQIATTEFVKTHTPKVYSFAFSDETTSITAGTGKISFAMPYAMNVTAIYCYLRTDQTSGSTFTIDINEGGVSILSTPVTLDNAEHDSFTATTPAVISDAALAFRAVITLDVDQIGDGTAKGGKCDIIGY